MPQPVAYPTGFFNDAILPMTEKPPVSSVQYLGFAWYAMDMGLFGLSLARAHGGGFLLSEDVLWTQALADQMQPAGN